MNHLSSRAAAAVVALVLPLATVAVASPADAAGKYYSSCSKLTKDFRNGVSKSKAASDKAVRNGHPRPAYGVKARSVYKTNASRLDRDKDGTACEQ